MANVAQMFMEIPPVTRTYITLFSIINVGVQLNYLTPYQLYFNYQSIMRGEVWRLATNFFYVGPIGLRFFFHLLFLYRHARYLEEGSFRYFNHLNLSIFLKLIQKRTNRRFCALCHLRNFPVAAGGVVHSRALPGRRLRPSLCLRLGPAQPLPANGVLRAY